MLRRMTFLLVLPALVGSWTVPARGALPPAAEWVPRQAVLVLNVRDPKAILDLALRPALIEAVASSPAYKAQAATEGFQQFQDLVAAFENRFKADWKTILRRMSGGGVTWAVGPNQGHVFLLDALDAEAPRALHDLLVGILAGGQPVDPNRVNGVDTWTLGPKEAHAILGKRMVIATGPNTLHAILAMRDGGKARSIAAVPGYRQAVRAAGPDAAAVLYANSGLLKNAPAIAPVLAGDKNPLVSVLASPLLEAVARSNWLALGLKVKDTTLTLEAITDAAISASGAARFAVPDGPGDGALANLSVPRQIAAASLHRDLRGFYAAKDELFPERTSGLIFFENMMGIFFTGRDLTEEVFAETGPKIRLVVAEQKYDPAVGTPAPQLPAFALVLQLKHPEKFSLVVEEAWQKAVGLVNFTRGQKAEPGLIIDRPVHRGTKYTVAAFIPPPDGEKKPADVRYNFRPALAMPGHHLILSSTDGLAEDVMDALARETARPPAPRAGLHSVIEIEGGRVASILNANREALLRQNMVDKGHTRQQAEGEIGMLLDLVKHVSRVALTVGADGSRSKAALRVELDLPSGQNGGK